MGVPFTKCIFINFTNCTNHTIMLSVMLFLTLICKEMNVSHVVVTKGGVILFSFVLAIVVLQCTGEK